MPVRAAAAAAAVVAPTLTACSSPTTGGLTGAATVTTFVNRYVGADGRVVRTDQGGDTVSEGQAYALLMTAAVGDRRRFSAVWAWTRTHLMQPDGLLAWHWEHGAVVGQQPATDADLGTAAALVVASRRFDDPSLLADARRMADAILAHETVPSAEGTALVAGPWAVSSTEYVDPSYLAPAELGELASAFGPHWAAIGSTSASQLELLTKGGSLPPDWAVMGADGVIHPAAPPGDPGSPATFGFDAVRAPVWMAVSCSAGLRAAAAGLLPALQRGGGELELDLGGHPDPGVRTPIGRIPLAAAEWASGHSQAAWSDLAAAARTNQSNPTYYATAWIALTTLGFDRLLGRSC